MNLRKYCHFIIGTGAIIGAGLFVSPADAAQPYPKVTNVSPNPTGTNEFWLTATNMVVTNIGGTNVHVDVYIDDPPGGGGATPGLPCPMIELNVGMMVICHFQNKLTNNVEGASIHWHGIELDNDSDGTGVTQDTILPGQTYLYRFIAPRAGLFWYHSHMLPGNTLFSGMYGPIVVTSNIETSLIASNILPSATYTFPLVMGDISFSNGIPGKVVMGTNYPINTLIQLCENSALGLNQSDQPFCGPAGIPGNIALVNGYPPILAGTTNTPTANSTPIYTVANHSRVRLQMFCESTGRDFYLSLHYPSGFTGDTNLYRIGGQGGLLDNVILDGGMQGGFNFIYNQGSIVVGTGMRADTMFYPSGNNGEVIELVGNPLPSPWNLSGTTAPGDGMTNLPYNYPIAFFVITNTGVTNAPIVNGEPILAGTSGASVSLAGLNTNALIAPPSPSEGNVSGKVLLGNGMSANASTNHGYTPAGPNIDGYAAVALDGNAGDGSWLEVPHPPSALWARVGDVLELAVINTIGNSIHPYHLHGFSMQPLRIMSTNLVTNLYTYPYTEYRDTIEIYPDTALVFRIKLTDRPKFADSGTGGPVTVQTDAPTGGAVGRWLMHCHIFLHTTIGMISELDVVSNTINRVEGPSAGSDSAVLAGSPGTPWTATTTTPWLHLSAPNQSGTGSTNVIFTYDANSGGTRAGALNIAGETVNVTQAGSTYFQAPAFAAVVNTGLVDPEDVAVDGAGNVYIDDSGDNAIKEWTLADNTVTTLVASGLGTPQGMAVDSLGNVYFCDFNNNAVKEWSAATHAVSIVVSNITRPSSVAVDGGGNLYIAVPGTSSIMKWTAANNSLTTLTSAGLSNPRGVAVDVAGNVYIADNSESVVREWLAQNGASVPLVTTGLNGPWDVAVDVAGNVYIADGGNNAIKKWSAVTGAVTTLVSGEGDPTGVGVDAAGNVYIADFSHDAVEELPNAYLDPSPKNETGAAGSDVVPPVLPTTQNLGPPFSSTTDVSWLNINGATNGVVNFGFTANAGSSRFGYVTVLNEDIPVTQNGPSYFLGSYTLLQGPAAGSNSVVLDVVPNIATWTASTTTPWLHLSPSNESGTGSTNIVFSYDANPATTRTGTVNISGQTLEIIQAGSTYVQAPGPVTALAASGLNEPESVAVDGSGNVYFSDSANNVIKKWTVANNTVTTLVSNGLSNPQGVALDGAGNVYFADFGNRAVKEWLAASNTVTTLFTVTFGSFEGVAVDGAGNVYAANSGANSIMEWTAANSNLTSLVFSFSPDGVAVDAAGNVYIAQPENNAIEEFIPASNSVVTLVSGGLNSPYGVAVDGSGNVYIADGLNNAIKKWSAASKTVTTLVSGLNEPTGVAVDGSGNVYIADFNNNAIKELPYAFVDPTAKTEGRASGSDVLPVVQLPSENLLAPFAPMVNQPWLSIGGAAGGVVTFDFTANTTTASRTGDITLLGESIPITQSGVVPPPILINARMVTNGVFQFGFTNANLNATFTVLSTTNLEVPLANWTVIGAASNISPGVLQFTDLNATNAARFYVVRSP
jgi:FtsP/CotA-like multicopper oxidase with cupredoxin domain/sugar lactone lactonase YvrE